MATTDGLGMSWEPGPGVLVLPSGRAVRGRGLRGGLRGGSALPLLVRALPPGPPPDFGVYLLGRAPGPAPWRSTWLHWPDFRLPVDPACARAVLGRAWEQAAAGRVEIACGGGRGRTGTALACLAVLDGVPPGEAVAFVRERYHRRAVETPRQRWYVEHFT